MTGIKLTLDDSGEPDVLQKEPESIKRCLIDHCEMVNDDWICGHTATSIWDFYRSPGWCPLFKWYRGSLNKEFLEAQRNEMP
jgi:hypothetical protein